MKNTSILLIIMAFIISFPAFAYQYTVADNRPHTPSCNCPAHYNYYGYNFPSSMFDYEVDTACVDFCIDKKHTAEQCMRVCSNR